jgi:hypothetical protein
MLLKTTLKKSLYNAVGKQRGRVWDNYRVQSTANDDTRTQSWKRRKSPSMAGGC